MKNRLFVFLLTASTLLGCATTETNPAAAKPVSPDRIYASTALTPREGGRVIFIRDSGLLGSAIYHHVYINGERAASLGTGEKFEIVLPAGQHLLGLLPTDPLGVRTIQTVDQNIQTGQTYYFRLSSEARAGGTRIQRFVPR